MASGKEASEQAGDEQAANSKHEKRMPDVFILLLSLSDLNFTFINVRPSHQHKTLNIIENL
jgi:hypothetical protein